MEIRSPLQSTAADRPGRKRILLAEDDADARDLIGAALRKLGFDVIEISDGRALLGEILSHYKESRAPTDLDLIITDVHLPVISGVDVLRGIRAARWATPAIIITGDTTSAIQRSANHLGAVLLSKPLDLDTLERAVASLLASPP